MMCNYWTEADVFFRVTYRIPIAGLGLATLLLADVVVVVAAIAAIG